MFKKYRLYGNFSGIRKKVLDLQMEDYSTYELLLNLSDVTVTGVKIEKNKIYISCFVKKSDSNCPCPNCGKESEKVNQKTLHRVRDLDISGREVWLDVKVRQLICVSCNRYFHESLSFADLNKSYTKRQAKFIFLLCQKQNYKEVGCIVNMNSKTVERLMLLECEKHADIEQKYAQVRRIGIDEQSHRKGKGDYFCVLTDLDRGIVIEMLENRLKSTIIAHFKSKGEAFCNQITAVSCDNWDAYIGVSEACFPNAKTVLDRFHVTKQLNECLDVVRKKLRREEPKNDTFKGLKWVLFKQYHTLSDKQLDLLDAVKLVRPEIGILYHKREEFHHILDNSTSVKIALEKLEIWKKSIVENGITAFDSFLKMLETKQNYVVNYVENYLSNAVTEGCNNLIRTIRRISFGMVNFQHLTWRVLAIQSLFH